MADSSTAARPYAKAVFELAREDGSFDQWASLLKAVASAVGDRDVAALIGDPRVGSARIGQIIVDALGEGAGQAGRNFVRLLAENGRLAAVPDILEGFEALRAEAEHTVDVNITSAAPLSEEHKAKLAQSLRARLGRDVRLHCEVDESLIGGAVIRAGDLVIDSSLRGRLQQLATNLNN